MMYLFSLTKRLWPFLSVLLVFFLQGCGPDQDIEFKQIKNVNVELSEEPLIKAEAVLFNPNDQGMKLRRINVEVYLNEEKVGIIDQSFKLAIPRKGPFTVPLEVKLATKESGLLNSLLGLLGSGRQEIRFKGYLKGRYQGLPLRIPVDYKTDFKMARGLFR